MSANQPRYTDDDLRRLLALLQTPSAGDTGSQAAAAGPPPVSNTPAAVTPSSQPPPPPPPASQQFQQGLGNPPPVNISIPVTQPYQSVRQNLGTSTTSTGGQQASSSASFQPILGLQGLAPPFSTTHANNARMASAAATIPSRTPLVRRRARGPARHAPSLPHQEPPSIRQCYVEGTITPPSIRITVKIYPPVPVRAAGEHETEIYYYRHLSQHFTAILEKHYLVYRYEMPESTTISDLSTVMANSMQQSPAGYTFKTTRLAHLLNIPVSPFQLLSLVDKGRKRPSDQQIRFRTEPILPGVTIANLAADKNKYSNPTLMIENGNRFVLHFRVTAHPLTGTIDGRRHTCVSKRIYTLFPFDHADALGDEDGNGDTSGGEDDGEDTPASLPSLAPSVVVSAPVQSSSTSSTRSLTRQELSFASTSTFLPSAIWQMPWSPDPSNHDVPRPYTLFSFPERIYEDATSGVNCEDVDIRDINVEAMAVAFEAKLTVCAEQGDFTPLLARERSFLVIDRDGSVVSSGIGVEREVVFTTFQKYVRSAAQWFTERMDSLSAISIMHSAGTARFVSPAHLLALTKLGALASLVMIYGLSPAPMDPCIFQFIAHRCDLHALHEKFVGDWHPELRQTILDWLREGPEGNVVPFRAHFATWHNIEVSALRDRDENSHNALASEMLYTSIFGTESYKHPEWQAFIRGVKLPCQNGFDFCQVMRSFEGGSEAFFDAIWASRIQDFGSLETHLQFAEPPSIAVTQLRQAAGSQSASFRDLLIDFLRGSGLPCPELFRSVSDSFSTIIDLSQVDEPGFRSRMLAWAATGCPSLDPRGRKIWVHFTDDDDSSYARPRAYREMMIREGRIAFATCYRTARIPISHILKLASTTYPGNSSSQGTVQEPATFRRAVDHWLLCQMLNAIGGHTIA